MRQLRLLQNGFTRLCDEVLKESRCRQCEERASWWDKVCSTCGTANPVILPREWLLYAATLLITSCNLLVLISP